MKKFFCFYLAVALTVTMSSCEWFKTTFLGYAPATEAVTDFASAPDSIPTPESVQVADSVPATDTTSFEPISSVEAASQPAVTDTTTGERYHVLVGSFKQKENAARLLELLQDKGYTPQIITFKNGFCGVSVSSHREVRAAIRELNKILPMDFCPDDAWVYDTHTLLHESASS
jgi:cell division protein FtsN